MKKTIFFLLGFLCSMGNAVAGNENWMTGLNDNIYISQMSLPGAHDAATKSLTIGKCQDKDIAGLWDAGVRVFDLRPTDSGNDCTINHGSLQTNTTLRAALTTITGRLNTYGSDFAIVLMRKEDGGDSWASKVASVINSFSDYVIPFSPSLRLRDVRGKVIILSRDYFADGYTINYWTDNTSRDVKSANGVDFVVQDYYKVEDKNAKSTAINNILSEARANVNTRCMFINHTSGYVPGLIPGLSDDITGNANTCNTLALNTITSNPGPTGIILMDYAGSSSYNGANLVNKIIEQNSSLTATVWAPPAAPGVSLTALAEDRDVFVYNIEADAIFSRGFNWLTMAMADRPEGGDNVAGAARQRVQVRKDGNNIKIHWNDRGADVFFGQADNTDAGSMWTDLGNAGNRVVFTPASSSNYPNAYTLTNVQHNQKVDVLWKRGGKLTLWNGQGFFDWVFMTDEALNSGDLPKFKARKAIWDLYQELVRVNAVDTYASALATANAVYVNANATTDQLRAAFRALFIAVAESIENPVDVSYLFTHPDISGDKTASGWSYTDFAISAGECEKYHATFSSSQSVSDAPNGLYEVAFIGIYRQDDGKNQAAPQLVVTSGGSPWTANFPNMEDLGEKWNIGGNPTDDWVTSNTGKKPKWMWSASDAQAHEDASAIIESVKVKDHTLNVEFKVTGGNQWFNFQRVFITYKGSINSALFKTLQAKIAEADDYVTANTGVIPASFITPITEALSAASVLTANSDDNDLTSATDAITAALNTAKAAPTIANLNVLQATVNLASNEGANAAAIAAAEAFLANPTTADALKAQLDAVRTARKIKALGGASDIYTGSAPVVDTEYYFFNLGTGMWLSAGSDWNTHAAVDQAGWIFKLNDATDGFTISCSMGWFNGTPYVDTNDKKVYTFQAVSGKTNVYNILQGSDLLGYNPNGKTDGKKYWNSVSNVAGADAADLNYQWKLVTKGERDALLEQATEQNPVDATYLIENPSLLRKPGYEMWTKECDGGNGGARVSTVNDGNGDRAADFAYEYYEPNSFSFSQQLSALRPGKYEVSVQAFYRHGNGDTQAAAVNNGDELVQLAYLFANGEQTLLPNVASVRDLVPGIGDLRATNAGEFPNMPQSAIEYFEVGAYKTTVQVKVGTDGQLNIGVKKDSRILGGDWVVFDNFRLTYLGPVEETIDVTITDAGYATLVAPFDATMPAGVTASTAEVNGQSIELTAISGAVPAHTPVILSADAAKSFQISGYPTNAPAELKAGALVGTYEDIQAPDGSYVLQNQNGKVGFYQVDASVVTPWVRANRAYLTAPANNPVKAYLFEDAVDAIKSVDAEAGNVEIFNVAGQRMNKLQRGVNIVNGKKVLVK